MASTIILAKLDFLQRCLARIQSKIPQSVEELEGDMDKQDIISLNLTCCSSVC